MMNLKRIDSGNRSRGPAGEASPALTAVQTSRRALLALSVLPWFSQAQADPAKTVRVIIPYTAGSVGDQFVRHLGELLRRQEGQVYFCDNRPGASQAIGAEAAAKAAPDGTTLFLGTQSGMVLNALARKKLPFDPIKDFEPITMLFTAPMYLFVSASVKAKSVQELIALARANPGKLTFASIGPGSSSHLAGELLKAMAEVDILHVPYRGGPEATNALITGEVDIMFNGGNVLAALTRGKVRAIGMASSRRVSGMPDLPTLNESGLVGFDVSPWFALFAPAGTPQPIIRRLNQEVVALLKDPTLREKAGSLSLDIQPSSPEQLATRLKSDFPVWEKVMRKAGIHPQ